MNYMIYFNDNEVKVLRDMIDCCDDCGNEVPATYSELLGAIRFKIDSELATDNKRECKEDGVAE